MRGARNALGRTVFATSNDSELRVLHLTEVDDAGLVVCSEIFDDDALDDAVAELEARYAAGEGRPHAEILAVAAEVMACTNRGDWIRFRSLLSDDFTFVDHRQMGFPSLDRDGFIAMQASYADQVRLSNLTQSVRVAGRAFLCTVVTVGTDPDGGEFEWVWHGVGTFDADHRYLSQEMFDEDDFATALARFDELSATATSSAPEHPEQTQPTLVNAAVRRTVGQERAFAARDWTWYRSALADDVVNDDRRPTVSSGRIVGREQTIALTESLAAVGFASMTQEPIAIRGERLALMRRAWRNPDGFDLDVLGPPGARRRRAPRSQRALRSRRPRARAWWTSTGGTPRARARNTPT